ncbi:hypothetical protein J5893_00190 [bacterium]|nr:hypothetical protein [bacterium]
MPKDLEVLPSEQTKIDPNLLKDDNPTIGKKPREEESTTFISSYVRGFVIGSIITVINILLIGVIFSYHIYITQTAKVHVDDMFVNFVPKYQGYLHDITSMLGMNKEAQYLSLPITSMKEIGNLNRIISTPDLTYAQKKQILSDKIAPIPNGIMQTINEIEELKGDIAKYGFLPLEIREILENELAISSIQRSLNSLEIIKFTAALKVFSFQDTTATLIGNMINMGGNATTELLTELANRGEKDVNAYVNMCYLNPFETAPECANIQDVNHFYQYILKDDDFNIDSFKLVMGAIEKVLEQNEIPSFSIIFNNFNALQQSINFNVEINTTPSDEQRLVLRGIQNPQVFILTSLINLLKQSIFIIGTEIDTKTLDISKRKITIDNINYIVNTSSKQFNLPIQKNMEREIFDYTDLNELIRETLEDEIAN